MAEILGNLTNMPLSSLDSFDIAILRLLQEDASSSIADIAAAVHLSQNACWRRIKLLEEAGIIKKRVALLDARQVGCGVTVFVSVKAAEHSAEWSDRFAAAVAKMPEVVEFYRMAGDVDYLLKVQVSDIQGYDEVYRALIEAVNLREVSGAFAMEELKHTHAVPLPKPIFTTRPMPSGRS